MNKELEKFEKVRKYYWITAYKRDRSDTGSSTKFSMKKPRPVPNSEMDWYNITFEEYLELNKKLKLNFRRGIVFKAKSVIDYDYWGRKIKTCKKEYYTIKNWE